MDGVEPVRKDNSGLTVLVRSVIHEDTNGLIVFVNSSEQQSQIITHFSGFRGWVCLRKYSQNAKTTST